MAEQAVSKVYRRDVRMSTRKVMIVLDLIRDKDAKLALGILKNTPKAAAPYITKLLNEAVANAENNFGMSADKLYVAECFATPGRTLKRIMPRAKGRADRILKRTSHITLAVKERN